MDLSDFKKKIEGIKQGDDIDFEWYPYNTLDNLEIIGNMFVNAKMRNWFDQLPKDAKLLDIGCADGDIAFYFETLGYQVDVIDREQTNYNDLKGCHYLKHKLDSNIDILEMDIDRNIELSKEYDLTFSLGLLYHLRNPLYFLNLLCLHSEYVLLSTRIASHAPDGTYIKELSMAYLLGKSELNNDPTNYWIFSLAGIQQLIERAGFSIICEQRIGCVDDSTPHQNDNDERYFSLIKRKENYRDIFLHHHF